MGKRLLMISTDRKIFEEGSAVRARQVEYAKNWEEVHIVVFRGRWEQGERRREKEGYKGRRVEGYKGREVAISPNCFVYSTHSWSRFTYPFGAMRLGRFIIPRRHITNITCQDSSLTAMAGVSLKDEFHIPLEIQIHEDLGSPHYGYTVMNRLRAWMARTYLPQADHIRVVSKTIKQFLIQRLQIPEQKIEVRPIAVDTDWIMNAPIKPEADLKKKFPQFSNIALVVGRLEKEKNVELAIHAWPKVLEAAPKAGLVIVGSGSHDSKLHALAKRLGIEDSVAFVGWADQKVLASYYKTADVLLSTSLFEGYGLVFKEAQAVKLPIVSTDVGIARECGAVIVDWTPPDVARGIRQAFGV